MTSQLRLAVTGAALIGGAALFLSGYWAGSAVGGATEPVASNSQTVPDWFLPIADYYDRNPAVTPNFDFAGLYDSKVRAHVIRREIAQSIPPKMRSAAHR